MSIICLNVFLGLSLPGSQHHRLPTSPRALQHHRWTQINIKLRPRLLPRCSSCLSPPPLSLPCPPYHRVTQPSAPCSTLTESNFQIVAPAFLNRGPLQVFWDASLIDIHIRSRTRICISLCPSTFKFAESVPFLLFFQITYYTTRSAPLGPLGSARPFKSAQPSLGLSFPIYHPI